MATYDFRVLLETVGGHKTSYFSSSFVNTDNNLVLSASQVYDRITGSVSCSYHNSPEFAPSLWSHPDTGSINTFFTFKDNTILSASLTGSLDTGVIEFKALDTEYDRLLRYKFFGDKICNTLGLPNNQWIYVDQMRLPADDESNYFQGNINAKNIYISDNISFANNSTLNTDLPIFINTGSDRHIKFIDERGTGHIALFMGYDKDTDKYEIGSDITKGIVLKGITEISSSRHDLGGSQNVIEIATSNLEVRGKGGVNYILRDFDDATKFLHLTLESDGDCSIKNSSPDRDLEIRTDDFNDAIYIKDSTERIGIGENTPASKLHIAGDLITDSHITASGDISASSGIVLGNQRRTTWPTGSYITDWYSAATYQSSSLDVYVDGNITGSNLLITSSSPTNVIKVGATGAGGLQKWEWHRDDIRKFVIYNDGRTNAIVPQDSLVFKHGTDSDGNDHINFHIQQDDQTVYFHGDVSASRLYTYGDTSPMVNLKRTDGNNVNAVIQFENGNGSMFAGIDGDAQNAGANIWGVGYAGDLIDNDGSNHATFVVTGSQVVINNATSASSGVALTVGGSISGSNLHVGQYIYHGSDTNTHINFTENDINIKVGNINFMDFTQDTLSELTINEAAQNLDVRIEGEADSKLFFTDASTSKVGIGTTSPQAKLHVEGDISASGTYYGYIMSDHPIGANNGSNNETAWLSFGPSGTTFSEDPNDTNEQVRRILLPFDGYIHSAKLRGETAPGNTTISFAKVSDGTDADTIDTNGTTIGVPQTINMSSAHTMYTFTGSKTVSTFSAGDMLAVSASWTTGPNDFEGSLILMFNVQE